MRLTLSLFSLLIFAAASRADDLPIVGDVDGQPLGQNADRVAKALELLGTPLPKEMSAELSAAVTARDAKKIQQTLDPRALLLVTINPEARVKVARGPAAATAQQAGWVPTLVKVVNDSTVKKPLRVSSPQAGDVHSQKEIKKDFRDRFLDLQLYTAPPLTNTLSGLKVEYAILLVYSSEAGPREATIGFDVGQGSQDLGFRGETPVLFHVKPAVAVKLGIKDVDGKPTVARFTFTDKAGHVYPPRAKRVAPDFFFQNQVYRPDGGTVSLPPGEFTMEYGRGPEYRVKRQTVHIPEKDAKIDVALERWIDPVQSGWYSGDHHIHGAGCAHYTSPTEGVYPEDMFLHVKGEALNVGCCLTWGPCFEYQRQFFEPAPNKLSEPFTVLKYDIEVSGFGSQALGHVCLLNLRDQTYPGSEGTKTKGWPTWTTPVMRWTKLQGGFTGYAHSANGLTLDRDQDKRLAAQGLLASLDADKNGTISAEEAAKGVLPDAFDKLDTNGDGEVNLAEIVVAIDRVKNKLPNLAIPPMNGIGAQEICVTSAMQVCDFISAMDTARVPEWNCWYHIMNCGFPLKASGETDFPCISGGRVGQGRVYVQLGKIDKVDYAKWCEGLAKGRSYISDGYSHALGFTVNGQPAGGEVKLDSAGTASVKAKVAFAKELPLGTAVGGAPPLGTARLVELIVNGLPVASKEIPADDQPHDVEFSVPLTKSSWVAIRQSPALHTNPVSVLIGGKPIRASRASAQWCVGVIEQLWRVREKDIIAAERDEARKTFQKAIEVYKKIIEESEAGT